MNENGYVDKAALQRFCIRRYRDVTLPFGIKACVQSLTAGESGTIQQVAAESVQNALLTAVAFGWVDGNHDRLFHEKNLEELRQLDSAITQAVYDAIAEHAGLSEAGKSELLEKNFETTAADCSPVA